MTKHAKPARTEPSLPVDPERLRKAFPSLTAEDLDAYVSITRRVLGDARDRARTMRDALTQGRAAREKQGRGETLSAEEALLVGYLVAVEKMQP
jgi:hypothetical protein